MSAFFFQTKSATAALLSVGPAAPVQMACVAFGCSHEACSGVPLAAIRGSSASLVKKVTRSPEVQMLCLATGCTHQGCVAARQSVLFAPPKPKVAAGADVGGVTELKGAVPMACVASNCSHASCTGPKRSSPQAPSIAFQIADPTPRSATEEVSTLTAYPLPYPTAQTKSKPKTGYRFVRRNAITTRSPRLDVESARSVKWAQVQAHKALGLGLPQNLPRLVPYLRPLSVRKQGFLDLE